MPDQTPEIPASVFDAARESTLEAGRLALSYFRAGQSTTAEVNFKHGGSPVTAADLAVDELLKQRLGHVATEFGWLSEETTDTHARLQRRLVWVVDPIDGTRAFARGDTDWTIAVGLVLDGVPIAGFVYAPVADLLFHVSPGRPVLRNDTPISVTSRSGLAGALLTGPRPLLDEIAGLARIERGPKVHSLAYRIVHVAEGRFDAGLAGGRSHDWDLAAAHAILSAAGGTLVDAAGREARYNRASTVHAPLAATGTALAPALVDAFRRTGQGS